MGITYITEVDALVKLISILDFLEKKIGIDEYLKLSINDPFEKIGDRNLFVLFESTIKELSLEVIYTLLGQEGVNVVDFSSSRKGFNGDPFGEYFFVLKIFLSSVTPGFVKMHLNEAKLKKMIQEIKNHLPVKIHKNPKIPKKTPKVHRKTPKVTRKLKILERGRPSYLLDYQGEVSPSVPSEIISEETLEKWFRFLSKPLGGASDLERMSGRIYTNEGVMYQEFNIGFWIQFCKESRIKSLVDFVGHNFYRLRNQEIFEPPKQEWKIPDE